jgi:hypothetical protein
MSINTFAAEGGDAGWQALILEQGSAFSAAVTPNRIVI